MGPIGITVGERKGDEVRNRIRVDVLTPAFWCGVPAELLKSGGPVQSSTGRGGTGKLASIAISFWIKTLDGAVLERIEAASLGGRKGQALASWTTGIQCPLRNG